jgi:hypothetical protein
MQDNKCYDRNDPQMGPSRAGGPDDTREVKNPENKEPNEEGTTKKEEPVWR